MTILQEHPAWKSATCCFRVLSSLSSHKHPVLPASDATAVAYTINLGYTRGLHRGPTGNTPSARAERSRGTGEWRQRKCSNCIRLRDQPTPTPNPRHSTLNLESPVLRSPSSVTARRRVDSTAEGGRTLNLERRVGPRAAWRLASEYPA